MPGSSSWMPYAPQGVKGFDGDTEIHTKHCAEAKQFCVSELYLLNTTITGISVQSPVKELEVTFRAHKNVS